jgi:hypothetical protein
LDGPDLVPAVAQSDNEEDCPGESRGGAYPRFVYEKARIKITAGEHRIIHSTECFNWKDEVEQRKRNVDNMKFILEKIFKETTIPIARGVMLWRTFEVV